MDNFYGNNILDVQGCLTQNAIKVCNQKGIKLHFLNQINQRRRQEDQSKSFVSEGDHQDYLPSNVILTERKQRKRSGDDTFGDSSVVKIQKTLDQYKSTRQILSLTESKKCTSNLSKNYFDSAQITLSERQIAQSEKTNSPQNNDSYFKQKRIKGAQANDKQQKSRSVSMYGESQSTEEQSILDYLTYDDKLKLVKQFIQIERNGNAEVSSESSQLLKERDSQRMKEAGIRAEHLKQQRQYELHRRVAYQQEQIDQAKLKRQQENRENELKISAKTAIQREKELDIEKKQLENAQKIIEQRNQERDWNKRERDERAKHREEESLEKQRQYLAAFEKEQKEKYSRHENILANKQKQIAERAYQRSKRAYSNIQKIKREEEEYQRESIEKIIQSTSPKKRNTSSESRADARIGEARLRKLHEEDIEKKDRQTEGTEIDKKIKQAEENKEQQKIAALALRREKEKLKRQEVLENKAIQEYQRALNTQKEIDQYKAKLQVAAINKNIKQEIQFLTHQGVADMFNIIKRQKEKE